MDPTTPANIPWYKSNVLRSLAVTTIAQVLSRFHVTAKFAPEAGPIVDSVLDLVSLGAVAYAAYSRTKHPTPNIVATQAKADVANAAPVPQPSGVSKS
jgi:hypothetical protein